MLAAGAHQKKKDKVLTNMRTLPGRGERGEARKVTYTLAHFGALGQLANLLLACGFSVSRPHRLESLEWAVGVEIEQFARRCRQWRRGATGRLRRTNAVVGGAALLLAHLVVKAMCRPRMEGLVVVLVEKVGRRLRSIGTVVSRSYSMVSSGSGGIGRRRRRRIVRAMMGRGLAPAAGRAGAV